MSDKSVASSGKHLEVSAAWFVLLHLSLALNSTSGVMAKMAGRYAMLSFRFCLFYGLDLLFVFIQALLWQQVLKHMSLTFANMNRPISIIYSLLWSTFLFREQVTPRMLIGSAMIIAGIILGVSEKPAQGPVQPAGARPAPAKKEADR